MNNNRQIQEENNRKVHDEDEVELMDYLLVIWRWKYLIIAGTLAIGFAASIISFVGWKQQTKMYRTSIVLKPGSYETDVKGNIAYIDSPENIKALIENDLKHKILDGNKNSRRTKLSDLSAIQVDISKGSNRIDVFIVSDSFEDATTKLNYLIKVLLSEVTDKKHFIQKKVEKRIEEKKYEFELLLFNEKEIKVKIKRYENELSDIEAKIKLLKDSKDISKNREYMLSKLSLENDYRKTFQTYFEKYENARLDLFKLQKKTGKLSKVIKELEKEKQNIHIIQIIQPPVVTELPESSKIKRNLLLSSIVGFFSMLALSFFGEYLKNYKKRVSDK